MSSFNLHPRVFDRLQVNDLRITKKLTINKDAEVDEK